MDPDAAGDPPDPGDDVDLRARHRHLRAAAERPDPRPGRRRCWCSPAVAIYRAVDGNSPLDELTPELSWLNPFGAGGAALSTGLLLGVFAYWGWESAVNLSEETTDGDSTPGPRRPAVDVHPARDLRLGRDRRGRLRRDPVAQRQRRRGGVRLRLPRRRRSSAAGTGSCCSSVVDRGDRLDPDHDHPGVAHRAVDGPPGRDPARGSATSIRGTAPPTSAPGRSPRSRSPGTSASTRSARTRSSTR